MVDTCHWSSLPLATQMVCGFHTPYSHFCAHRHWKAFTQARTHTHTGLLETETGAPRPPRDFWLP